MESFTNTIEEMAIQMKQAGKAITMLMMAMDDFNKYRVLNKSYRMVARLKGHGK
jgi:hypothetical protein